MISTITVQSLIKTHLESDNIKYLEPALELGIGQNINPSLLGKGFTKVGNYYLKIDSPARAALAYEKARVLIPNNTKTVGKLFNCLYLFWNESKKDVSQDDLTKLGEYIGELVEFYYKHPAYRFYLPAIRIGQKILNEIESFFEEAPNKIETPASYTINQIISVKYDYLTPEQRKKEYGRIIGKSLRKILNKRKIEKQK